MKVTGHLVLTPIYTRAGRINGIQITAVRQNAPTTLRQGARSVRVSMEVLNPEAFFHGQTVDLGVVTDDHTVLAGAVIADAPIEQEDDDDRVDP